MSTALTKEDLEFRRIVVENDGALAQVAAHYGVTPSAISHRLWSEKHAAFWGNFKKRRSRRRRAARQARWRAGRREHDGRHDVT